MHKIVEDKIYPKMYRVEWVDGKVSDMVNLTRAKDAIRCYEEYTRRFDLERPEKAPRSPVRSFKLKRGTNVPK